MTSYWNRFAKIFKKTDSALSTEKGSQPNPIYVFPMRWKAQMTTVLSLVNENPDHSIGPGIVGSLKRPLDEGGKIAPENFLPNEEFVAFIHYLIERSAPESADLQAAARDQREGRIYIIDGRTPDPQGAVPPEDIIGSFEVHAGVLLPDSYQRNPNHLIMSANGLFQLPRAVHHLLLKEVQHFISMFDKVEWKAPEFRTDAMPTVVVLVQPPGGEPYNLVTAHRVEMFEQGLKPEVILGRLNTLTNIEAKEELDAGFSPENFYANPVFKSFLHAAIAKHAPALPEYQRLAQSLRDGWLYLIDGRIRTANGVVPVQDVIGAFFVQNAVIKSNSYRRNDRHRLLTDQGFFQLSEALTERIIDDMVSVNAKSTSSTSGANPS